MILFYESNDFYVKAFTSHKYSRVEVLSHETGKKEMMSQNVRGNSQCALKSESRKTPRNEKIHS